MANPFLVFKRKQTHSDEELVALYKSSADTHHLGLLYERYMHLVFGLCFKYFKDRDKSKDAVVDIYEKLSNEILKHDIKNFKSWLYVLTKNYCLMDLRKNSQLKQNYIKKIEQEFMESTHLMHPIDEDTDEQMMASLKYCMEQLKDLQRLCVELFYYEKKCYKEIAQASGLTENNVKSFIQNGKRNLKMCIEGKMVA